MFEDVQFDNRIPIRVKYATKSCESQPNIARWYEAGLANSDRIHLTHEGYRLQGELLCDALIRAYNDYKGFSGNSAIAPNTHLIEKLPQIPLDEVVSTPQKQQ